MPSTVEVLEANMREVREDIADIKATSRLTHDAVRRMEEALDQHRLWKDGDHVNPASLFALIASSAL